MRILMVSQYFPPEVGATQTRMHCFAKTLAEKGHLVTVITEVPNHPAGIIQEEYRNKLFVRSREEGCQILRLWVFARPQKTFFNRILFYCSFLVNAVLAGLLLTRGKYDVLFVTSPPLPVGLAGYILGLFKRCPFVLDIRDLWPLVAPAVGEMRRGALYRLAERLELFLYKKATLITCVTRSFVRYIQSKGIPEGRVVFVPNGTVPEIFNPEIKSPELREALGFDGKFVVSFCGNHGVAQDLSGVLDAAKLLSSEERIVFCFIGEGPAKASLLMKQERENIKNVVFLPQVPLHAVAPYINASDLLLVPLKANEIFQWFIPSKIFDFMACGKPIILTVDGEAREILKESRCGVYVPPDSPEALARAVLDLSRKGRELVEMGQRGREYVLTRFTRAAQGELLEKLLGLSAHGKRDAEENSLVREETTIT